MMAGGMGGGGGGMGGMGGGMGNGGMGGGMGGAEQWQSSTRWDQRTCEKMGYSGRASDSPPK